MIGTVVSDVLDVPHLALVTVPYPFDLLGTVVLDPVNLLSIIFSQSLELLALVLLNAVQHLVNVLPPGSTTDLFATEATLITATSVKETSASVPPLRSTSNKKKFETSNFQPNLYFILT